MEQLKGIPKEISKKNGDKINNQIVEAFFESYKYVYSQIIKNLKKNHYIIVEEICQGAVEGIAKEILEEKVEK